MPALTRALDDADSIVRGLSAIALRDAGRAASALALDTLIGHLADPDENVRMMTAQAISTQGPAAKRAMPELMKACRVEGQHPHVLGSLADALGLIGPEAREALPVLRDLTKIPRVRWAAELAIQRIEAH